MRIDRLEPSKHIKGRYLLHLSDASLVKVTENEIVSFRLCAGGELDEETLTALKAAGGLSNAKALGAKLLGARPLSRRDLIAKLVEKEISPQDAEDAADWLEEIGALDDGAYAQMLVRHYSARSYGRRRLEQELYRRGVPRELWEDALTEAPPPEDGIDKAIAAKLRGRTPDEKALKKVSDFLLRRGYSWSQVKAGLRRYGSEIIEE